MIFATGPRFQCVKLNPQLHERRDALKKEVDMERIWLKSYPEGVPAEIDAKTVGSIGDFIKASIEKFRDRTAFLSMGRAMSYGGLERKSRDFASYLQNVARLKRGARVALMMPNLMQYPIALFGALRAGYVVV